MVLKPLQKAKIMENRNINSFWLVHFQLLFSDGNSRIIYYSYFTRNECVKESRHHSPSVILVVVVEENEFI